jgi:hypothetical protein
LIWPIWNLPNTNTGSIIVYTRSDIVIIFLIWIIYKNFQKILIGINLNKRKREKFINKIIKNEIITDTIFLQKSEPV